MKFTIEEIKRAAAEQGAEPVYTQAAWRSMVNTLLTERNTLQARIDNARGLIESFERSAKPG